MKVYLMNLGTSTSTLILLPSIVLLLILLSVISLSVSLPYWFVSYGFGTAILSFTTTFTDEIGSSILRGIQNFSLYIPLGIYGIWRWGIWLFKKLGSLYYSPINSGKEIEKYTMGIITPVYNENPSVFRAAVDSWQSNNPDELIAVIDQKDMDCIRIFQEFAKNKPWAKLIVTSKAGKRPALADGILASKSDIVALVDSDTIWDNNIRDKLLAPFQNPIIGGVTTRQHPIERHSLWQKMTDIFWDNRNYYDLPSQTAMAKALTCLSGRSSLYRRHIILPKLNEFLNEILFGRKKESGEDKCLTRLVQSDGWKTYYQSNAVVFSSAASDFKTFWSQRLRWTRNSHNSDIISLWDGWAWKNPYLAFYMIDRFITIFTLFFGPIFFSISVYYNDWVLALSILGLWICGRGIKIIPHLRRHPKDILLLPVYVAVNFLLAFVKLYALVTIREQKWIRSAQERTVKSKGYFKKIKDIFLTTEIICSIVIFVVLVLQ
jgi:cellulose synthase/poly-beta-1,6-N-acetylglucosamine synthase-like glycosyltransferase